MSRARCGARGGGACGYVVAAAYAGRGVRARRVRSRGVRGGGHDFNVARPRWLRCVRQRRPECQCVRPGRLRCVRRGGRALRTASPAKLGPRQLDQNCADKQGKLHPPFATAVRQSSRESFLVAKVCIGEPTVGVGHRSGGHMTAARPRQGSNPDLLPRRVVDCIAVTQDSLAKLSR